MASRIRSPLFTQYFRINLKQLNHLNKTNYSSTVKHLCFSLEISSSILLKHIFPINFFHGRSPEYSPAGDFPMNPDGLTPAPRKLRFEPKRRSQRRIPSITVPKIEDVDDTVHDETRKKLLQRYNESRQRQRRQVENKAPVQVAFAYETRQFTSSKAFNGTRDGALKQSSESDLMQLDDVIGKSNKPSSSAGGSSATSVNIKGSKIKDYIEPWDYMANYPSIIPWRIPYSGDPEILDEAEFGEDARQVEYDETTINPAAELGFLNPDETGTNNRLMFFQFPESLPTMKRFASAKGKEMSLTPHELALSPQAGPSLETGVSQRISKLDDLAAGHMGKLVVLNTGAVKLKLGEILYDVSPGANCNFAQDLVAVNTKAKHFCEIGSLDGRAIVTPDIDYLINCCD